MMMLLHWCNTAADKHGRLLLLIGNGSRAAAARTAMRRRTRCRELHSSLLLARQISALLLSRLQIICCDGRANDVDDK
jgi:hypothetical protein